MGWAGMLPGPPGLYTGPCSRPASFPPEPRRDPQKIRPTAARNMVDAGGSERVAVKVTERRTRAVFDHNMSPADLQDVATKLTGTPAPVRPQVT